jgi:hypothetical protein
MLPITGNTKIIIKITKIVVKIIIYNTTFSKINTKFIY